VTKKVWSHAKNQRPTKNIHRKNLRPNKTPLRKMEAWEAQIEHLLGVPHEKIHRCVASLAKHHRLSERQIVEILDKHYSATKLEHLPPEIREMVVGGMDIKSILAFCATSKEFSRVCQSAGFWRALLMRDYGIQNSLVDARVAYKNLALAQTNRQKHP
jgi:hypothetical protein